VSACQLNKIERTWRTSKIPRIGRHLRIGIIWLADQGRCKRYKIL